MIPLSDDLEIPTRYVTSVGLMVGKRGAGKTHNTAVLVEGLARAGAPVTVIDPVGVWWGLRSAADGNGPGLPFVVLGGRHGHLPLHPEAGRAVARFVVEAPRLLVLDLSLFGSKAERNRFVTAFTDELYERNTRPVHVVLEEAAQFAPQKPQPGEQTMLAKVVQMVLLGRQRGIGCTLATQRPAILHKDVLTQADYLFAMRLTGPRDKGAIKEWIASQADDEHGLVESLPTLETGAAWVWNPEGDILQRVRFRRRDTFDSSRTPELGDVLTEPTVFADVDLGALAEAMATADGDPGKPGAAPADGAVAALRAQLAEQRRELDALKARGLSDEDRATMRAWLADAHAAVAELTAALKPIADRIGEVAEETVPAPGPRPAAPAAPAARRAELPPAAGLARAERALLAVLVAAGKDLTAAQLAALSGYSARSSSFGNALGSLRSAGLITRAGRTSIAATDAGRAALPDVPPLPTGRALVSHWLGQLEKAPRALLQTLVNAHPSRLTAAELSAQSGYSLTSSSFTNALGRLRTLNLAEGGRGAVGLGPTLREAM